MYELGVSIYKRLGSLTTTIHGFAVVGGIVANSVYGSDPYLSSISKYLRSVQAYITNIFNDPTPETPPPAAVAVPSVLSITEQFVQTHKARLLNTYQANADDQPKYSANIDEIFYSKREWTELLKDESNYLEKKWRTKILFANTPRGNVAMWYDAYKLGFAYYSDQTIPYPVLNAVAMKYVSTFCCRDFFMDEVVLGSNPLSGIVVKHREETRAEIERNKAEQPSLDDKYEKLYGKPATDTMKSAPFAKFKSYNNVSAKAKSAAPDVAGDKLAEEKQTNRFIYLGKMHNMCVLRKDVGAKNERRGAGYSRNATSGACSELHASGVHSIFSQPDTRTSTKDISASVSASAPTTSELPPAITPIDKQKMSYSDYKKIIKS
jgi:hypothetical protein